MPNFTKLSLLLNRGSQGSHSCQKHSSRLSTRCEWDEVWTNADIHTHVRELRDKVEIFSFPLTRDRFTDIFPRASRWDKNRLRTWQTRQMYQMYPSHSRSRLVLSWWECKPGIAFSKVVSSFWYYWHHVLKYRYIDMANLHFLWSLGWSASKQYNLK